MTYPKTILLIFVLILCSWTALLAVSHLLPPVQYPQFYNEEFGGHRYIVYGYIYRPSDNRPFVHDPDCPCHR